jgi:MscS family membrane protein
MAALLASAALPAAGQPLASPSPGTGAERPPAPLAERPQPPAAPDSPRASLARYLDLCRDGGYAEAARYLDLPESEAARGALLARRLKAVLDRHLWVDLDSVSPLAGGDPDDGLPAATDEIGRLAAGSGPREPVRLRRLEDPDEPRWLFAQATVRQIDRWYEALPDRWLRERLPEFLLRPGPRELLRWQWGALVLLFPVALLLGRLLAGLARRLLARFLARTRPAWDDAIASRLVGPATLAFALAAARLLVPALGLYAPAEAFVGRLLRSAALLTLFWAMWRVVDVAREALWSSAWARTSASALSLISVGGRLAKLIVAAFGLVAALSELGYPVAGMLAGLGLGGLALALAAQKTVENLFGSASLALDRPFGVGDFVKVEDFVGTVEAIGLRSTKFRTLDRTLVSIPNGRLADMRLESYSARDRMRLACTLGLVYGTTAEQLRRVLHGLEEVLRSHPRIWPEAVVVRFKEFGACSLDVEVMAWFETPDWSEFQLIRQEVLLRFMEVVERAGTSFAFPTRTVHVVGGTPLAAERGAAANGGSGDAARRAAAEA